MKHICSALKRNSDQNGFTLVELIVVIAILAILSAIAYPVYTGYITKANEAADLTLLGHVNESFVSALLDDGYYDGLPDAAQASFAADNTLDVSSVSYAKPTAEGGTKDTSLETLFAKYYAGNEKTKFKVYTKLGYDAALGGFYGVLSDGTMVTAGGKKITIEKNEDGTSTYTFEKDGKTWSYTVNDADLETYKAVIGQNIGVDELMSALDTCGVAAQSTFAALLQNSTSRTSMLGADGEAAFKKYLSDNNIPENSSDPRYQKAISNAVIMAVANMTKGKTADDIINVVNGGHLSGAGVTMAIGDAATAYGVLTVWAQDPEYKDKVLENANGLTAEAYWKQLSGQLASGDSAQVNAAKLDIIKLGNKIKGSSFDEYSSSENGKKAIEGYVAALNTLNSNVGTLRDANGNNVYGNGFADEDLVDMLMAVFGG